MHEQGGLRARDDILYSKHAEGRTAASTTVKHGASEVNHDLVCFEFR